MSLFEWMKGRMEATRTPQARPAAAVAVADDSRPRRCGKYLPLYTYLNNRYADRVVLSFDEMEDILGCSLPGPARLDGEWWTMLESSTSQPRFSDCWTLANRTARPNMRALNVVFDRTS